MHLEGTLSTCAVPGPMSDYVATSTAPCVQYMLDEGAIVLGKTNLPAGAADVQSYNDKYATANNPGI